MRLFTYIRECAPMLLCSAQQIKERKWCSRPPRDKERKKNAGLLLRLLVLCTQIKQLQGCARLVRRTINIVWALNNVLL